MSDNVDTPKPKFSFLIDNFAAFSTLTTAMAASLSMIFLFSYLSVFDAYLIMTIEYSDLLKFVIIGICFASTILLSTRYILDHVINNANIINPPKIFLAFTVLAFIAYISFPVYGSYYHDRVSLPYQVDKTACILYVAIIIILYVKIYPAIKVITFKHLYNAAALLALFVVMAGFTCGVYVRDKGTIHSVSMRENETTLRTIENVGLILFTSHHVILSYADTVLVVPTANITEMRAIPAYPLGNVAAPILSIP